MGHQLANPSVALFDQFQVLNIWKQIAQPRNVLTTDPTTPFCSTSGVIHMLHIWSLWVYECANFTRTQFKAFPAFTDPTTIGLISCTDSLGDKPHDLH